MTEVYITLDNVPGYTRGILGKIENETEKAVQISAYTSNEKQVTSWFPKKALLEVEMADGDDCVHYDLARWFTPSGWTEKFIKMTATSSLF